MHHLKPRLFAAGIALAYTCLATAQAGADDDSVLFVPNASHPIKAGRFSALAEFQAALQAAAERCGIAIARPATFADGVLGAVTLDTIRRVAVCAAFKAEFGASPAADGLITLRLWKRLAPAVAVPDALARSFTMSLGAEATDYTDIEFNSPSDGGIITWGPQGATVGQAHQVQQILLAVSQEVPGLIDSAFGMEATAIRLLMKTMKDASAVQQVSGVTASAERSRLWRAGFRTLGSDSRVRVLYDRVMTTQGTAGIPEAVKDFYRSYWAHGWCPTEIDLGFFVDRAVQITVYQRHTDQAALDVVEVEKTSGSQFNPAQRRRAIAANYWAGKPAYVGDRLARDVAYYIDAIPSSALTNETLLALVASRVARKSLPEQLNDEVGRWQKRLGISAAAYGLTDAAAIVPFGLSGEPSDCSKLRASSGR